MQGQRNLSMDKGIDFLVERVITLRGFGKPIISLEGDTHQYTGIVRTELMIALMEKYRLVGQSHQNWEDLNDALKDPRKDYIIAESVGYITSGEYDKDFFPHPVVRAYVTKDIDEVNDVIRGNIYDGIYDLLIEYDI